MGSGQTDTFHLGIKALIVDDKDSMLLLRVNLKELSGYKGAAYWDIPGGRLHRGDSIRETLEREVYEETGLTGIGPGVFLGSALSNIRVPVGSSDVGLILFVYAFKLGHRPRIELSEEHVESSWMSKGEAAAALATKYPMEFTNLLREY